MNAESVNDKNTLCKNLPKIQLHRIDQTTNAILYDGEFIGEIVFEQGEYCVRAWYELRYPSAVFEVNGHSARIESPLRNFREVGRCRTMEEAVKLAQAYISTTSGETDGV